MNMILEEKKVAFDSFAAESAVAEAYDSMIDRDWIRKLLEKEREKYFPAVI